MRPGLLPDDDEVVPPGQLDNSADPASDMPRSQFYYPDGNFVLRAGGQLYRLHQSRLRKFQFFDDLLGDASGALRPDRLSTDGVPLVDLDTGMHHIQGRLGPRDINAVCYWLYEQDEIRKTRDVDLLEDLLNAASILGNEDASVFAERAIQSSGRYSPLARLDLGKRHRRAFLVERAYRDIMATDARRFDLELIRALGDSEYREILLYQAEAHLIREYALLPPEVHHVHDCPYQGHKETAGVRSPCSAGLEALWLIHGQVLYHPERKGRLTAMREHLEETLKTGIIKSSCILKTLDNTLCDGAWYLESQAYAKAIRQLQVLAGVNPSS